MTHTYLCGEPGCGFQCETYKEFSDHMKKHEHAQAERNLERISRRNAGLGGVRE